MEISDVIEALEALVAPEHIITGPLNGPGYVRIQLPRAEYNAAVTAVANLKLADMVNSKRAIAAFPKLVTAVQLVLSIERAYVADRQVLGGYGSSAWLSKKTKAQLIKALEIAEEEIPS